MSNVTVDSEPLICTNTPHVCSLTHDVLSYCVFIAMVNIDTCVCVSHTEWAAILCVRTLTHRCIAFAFPTQEFEVKFQVQCMSIKSGRLLLGSLSQFYLYNLTTFDQTPTSECVSVLITPLLSCPMSTVHFNICRADKC